VRALSSGKVHPSVLHAGSFDMGMGSSDILAETPVVCCNHVAAVVHEHAWLQATLTIKGTVIVWNWTTGNQVAIIVSSPALAMIISNVVLSDQYLHVSDAISPSSMRHTC
jgi:hypothetical protein